MHEPLLSSKEKHIDAGVYEEEAPGKHKPGPNENVVLKEELKEIDKQIENEYKESVDWNKEMYKDFQNPNCPTLMELLDKCTETLSNINKLENDLLYYYTEQKMRDLLIKLFEVLGNLTRQFEMLCEIIRADDNSYDHQAMHSKYHHLGDLGVSWEKRPQICFKVLAGCVDYLLKNLLLDLHKTMHHLFEKRGTLSNSVKANEIQIMTAKIKVVSEYLPLAACFDNKDIFALEEDHPYRKDLMKHVKIKTLGTTEKIKKSFKKFIQGILVGVSMVSKGAEQENIVAKKLTVSFGAVYYFFSSSEAQKQANLFYSQPQEKIAFETWNMLEDEFVAGMMKITLPSIRYAERVYINRMYDPLTLDLINNARRTKSLNTLAHLNYDVEPNERSEEVTTLKINNKNNVTNSANEIKIKGLNKVPILVLSNRNLSIRKYTELQVAQRPGGRTGIKTEIVAEKHVEEPGTYHTTLEHTHNHPEHPRENNAFCGFFDIFKGFGCLGGPEDDRLAPDFDGLVIHIHGGGFVSMSSNSHQSYTRQWSKILRKPIFSIDYRLAPEHPYPAALDDVWQAYNWILNHAEDVLGVVPSRVVIAGDSSGANLALGVTALALKCGVRPPDGLFLAYPALRLETRVYSPSLMLALDDQLIPYSLLKLCMQAYVPPGADPSTDPLLSPIHYSDEIIKALPPIRMIVGDSDPLHDECWRFTDRLRKLGKDVFLTVYKDMCHGFLGYDVPMGMPESKVCIKESAEMIAELLKGHSGHPFANSPALKKKSMEKKI